MLRFIERTRKTSPFAWRQLARRALAATLPRRRLLMQGPVRSQAVCLTFDDGPHPEHTPALLDALKTQGVAATFFVIGQNVERFPDIVRRMAGEGHAVAHHSYSHSDPRRTSARELLEEIQRTQDVLVKLVGGPSRLFRPPHGRVTPWKLWSLWRGQLTVVLWNVDSKDYACRSAGELETWFQAQPLQGGDIVLMHDNHPHGAQTLCQIVTAARERGLTFATVESWTK